MPFTPGLLEGCRHANEQHVGTARSDFFDYGLVVFSAEVAVAEADDLDAWVSDTSRVCERRDHLAPGTEEIHAQPLLSGRCQQARYQIDAGHSLWCRLA